MSHRLTVSSGAQSFFAIDEESILEATDRAGIKAPRSCLNGNCMICEAKLLEGKVSLSYGAGDEEHFLACKSVALTDCKFEFLHQQYRDETLRLACQVLDINVNDSKWQLHLLLPAGKHPPPKVDSYELIAADKSYPASAAHLQHRELKLITAYDPTLYLSGKMIFIRYQPL